MVSAASLNIMETSAEHPKEQLPKMDQAMEVETGAVASAPAESSTAVAAAEAPLAVPQQIVVTTSSSSAAHKKDRRRKHRKSSGSGKDKDKVAAKRKSSSGKHSSSRRRSKHGEKGETKEQRRSRRRSRKSSKSSDPDPNDPATIAKSRELLLAAMGVKKQPDVAPCFVSAKTNLDSNPVYQSNRQRMASRLSESHLSTAASEAEFSLLGVAAAVPMETSRSTDNLSALGASASHLNHDHSSSSSDSEYDQFVEF